MKGFSVVKHGVPGLTSSLPVEKTHRKLSVSLTLLWNASTWAVGSERNERFNLPEVHHEENEGKEERLRVEITRSSGLQVPRCCL